MARGARLSLLAAIVVSSARLATAGADTSVAEAIRGRVVDLGYGPDVGDGFATAVASWPCAAWRAALAGGSPAGDMTRLRAEERVVGEIGRRLAASIAQADGGSRYWNLPDVLADRRAQCLGNCQLWHVLGNAVGLDVAAVEVSRPPTGELAEHETHVATLVRLADGRVRMIDVRYRVDDAPFRFAEVYRPDAGMWRLSDTAGRRSLHRRVRPLDPAGIEAAILLNIGNTYRRAGREDEAGPIYERAAVLDPGSVPLRLAVADTLVRQGLWDDAERAIRGAIAMDGENSSAHAALGLLLTRVNRNEEAVAALDRAIALKPASPDAVGWRARAARGPGRERTFPRSQPPVSPPDDAPGAAGTRGSPPR